jgi:hypothetical protein
MILQVFGPVAASEGLRRAGEYPENLCEPDDMFKIEPLDDKTEPVDDFTGDG